MFEIEWQAFFSYETIVDLLISNKDFLTIGSQPPHYHSEVNMSQLNCTHKMIVWLVITVPDRPTKLPLEAIVANVSKKKVWLLMYAQINHSKKWDDLRLKYIWRKITALCFSYSANSLAATSRCRSPLVGKVERLILCHFACKLWAPKNKMFLHVEGQ